jgi:hypothetical protein
MPHILIVDDEADIRESLETILREEDYAITSAGTIAQARIQLRDTATASSSSPKFATPSSATPSSATTSSATASHATASSATASHASSSARPRPRSS